MWTSCDRREWLKRALAGIAPMSLGACGAGDALPSTAPSRFLTVGTQRIAVYESRGTGPAILMVHGNSSSAKIWQQSLDGALGRRYRIVAIDLPGHGASSDAAAENRTAVYSIPGYAAVIRSVSDQLSLGRAVYVGWSLGGHGLLEASTGLPQAAGHMVFGTPPLPFPPASDFGGAFFGGISLAFVKDLAADQALQLASTFLSPGATAPSFLVSDVLRTDGYARAMVATMPFADEVVIARNMSRPFAILHGAQEQIANLAYLQALAPSLPTLWKGQVQVVANAGHAVQWEQPSRFDALLDAFVTDCLGN